MDLGFHKEQGVQSLLLISGYYSPRAGLGQVPLHPTLTSGGARTSIDSPAYVPNFAEADRRIRFLGRHRRSLRNSTHRAAFSSIGLARRWPPISILIGLPYFPIAWVQARDYSLSQDPLF
ncbi:unnamed protein product [Linum trigynum]|uniref:Uncharacterized protein n=1 Tax=Linum trigynum TaxID=586398 RepID=A0AAV2EAS2_9ROSI